MDGWHCRSTTLLGVVIEARRGVSPPIRIPFGPLLDIPKERIGVTGQLITLNVDMPSMYHSDRLDVSGSPRPNAVPDRSKFELVGIDHRVLNSLTVPCVCDMNEAVARLNDRGITVFSGRRFQNESRVPVLAVGRFRQIQRRSALCRMIINE